MLIADSHWTEANGQSGVLTTDWRWSSDLDAAYIASQDMRCNADLQTDRVR